MTPIPEQAFPRPASFPVLLQVSPLRYVVVEVNTPYPASAMSYNGSLACKQQGVAGGWLRQNFYARAQPLTQRLTHGEAMLVLLLMQERRRDEIPKTWLEVKF